MNRICANRFLQNGQINSYSITAVLDRRVPPLDFPLRNWFSISDEKATEAAMTTPSTLVPSQSYMQKMSANGAVVKQLPHQQLQQQQQQQQQSSGSTEPLGASSAVTKPNFNSVGEIATGVMLAGCVTSWGWGYGLGWQEPVKHLFSKFYHSLSLSLSFVHSTFPILSILFVGKYYYGLRIEYHSQPPLWSNNTIDQVTTNVTYQRQLTHFNCLKVVSSIFFFLDHSRGEKKRMKRHKIWI